MGTANGGLNIPLTSKKKEHAKKILAMKNVVPRSNELIGGPIPTIDNTLDLIRVNNIGKLVNCENRDQLITELDQMLYGLTLVHTARSNVLFGYEERTNLGEDFVKALKTYFERTESSRILIARRDADIDDAVKEAGHIQFIQEMTKRGPRELRNLYR